MNYYCFYNLEQQSLSGFAKFYAIDCVLKSNFCNFASIKHNLKNMFRNHTCGELRLSGAGSTVTLAGWVQRVRKMGGMTFVDLRDRYGITQLVFDADHDAALHEAANKLGREFVIQAVGTVAERTSKNPNLPTGDIEKPLSRPASRLRPPQSRAAPPHGFRDPPLPRLQRLP